MLMIKKLLFLMASTSALCAWDYSYFEKNPSVAPNGEALVYVPEAELIAFSGVPTASNPYTAIDFRDGRIKSWATGYKDMIYGSSSLNPTWSSEFKTPDKAVGAVTTSETTEGVTCLGDGGSITMTFSQGISNGEGYDFAIFENGFSANYLELAYVEVSSDGVHFVRFPNFYLGDKLVKDVTQGEEGMNYPTDIYNLGSKYESGFGNCYDLEELKYAYDYLVRGGTCFSDEYAQSLLENFGWLDFDNIGYIRLIDIFGDGSCKDSTGHAIYDPAVVANPLAPGFDLKGIGVLHEGVVVPEPAEWAAIFGAIALVSALCRRRK